MSCCARVHVYRYITFVSPLGYTGSYQYTTKYCNIYKVYRYTTLPNGTSIVLASYSDRYSYCMVLEYSEYTYVYRNIAAISRRSNWPLPPNTRKRPNRVALPQRDLAHDCGTMWPRSAAAAARRCLQSCAQVATAAACVRILQGRAAASTAAAHAMRQRRCLSSSPFDNAAATTPKTTPAAGGADNSVAGEPQEVGKIISAAMDKRFLKLLQLDADASGVHVVLQVRHPRESFCSAPELFCSPSAGVILQSHHSV